MKNLKLTSLQNNKILFEGEFKGIKECVEHALLNNIIIENVDLGRTDMTNASYDGGIFKHTDFTDANMTGANLSECVFENCNFDGAALYNACLCGSQFINCSFENASFGGTDIAGAAFENCLFSTLSCFDLDFRKLHSMHNCLFKTLNHESLPMNNPPIVIKGLSCGILVFLDKHIKIGAKVFESRNWPACLKMELEQSQNMTA